METNKFYVEHKGRIQGPFTLRQVRYLAETNQITPETPVQINDSTEWLRACEIAGLNFDSKNNQSQKAVSKPAKSTRSTSSEEPSPSQEIPFFIITEPKTSSKQTKFRGSYTPPYRKKSHENPIGNILKGMIGVVVGLFAVCFIIGVVEEIVGGFSSGSFRDPTIDYWNTYHGVIAEYCDKTAILMADFKNLRGDHMQQTMQVMRDLSQMIQASEQVVVKLGAMSTNGVDLELVALAQDEIRIHQKMALLVNEYKEVAAAVDQVHSEIVSMSRYDPAGAMGLRVGATIGAIARVVEINKTWTQYHNELQILNKRRDQIHKKLQERFGEEYIP